MGAYKSKTDISHIEWQTLLLIAACYAAWFGIVVVGNAIPTVVWIFATAIITTLHLSIVHEVVHGHPTRNPLLNKLMVLLPISWVFPYDRFRDTHLEHHDTGALTDPLDDPESWYVYAFEWENFGKILKCLLTFNNTLFGRMLLGPGITLIRFVTSEITVFARKPDLRLYISSSWIIHIALCMALIWFLSIYGSQPIWIYLVATYLGMSILLIRTFLEHQAAEDYSERTVIIERSCPIACLFLFNNLHALHHEKPGIPWYRLPSLYREQREELLAKNNHYFYTSYSEIFRRYFFHPKEPVTHPHIGRNVG